MINFAKEKEYPPIYTKRCSLGVPYYLHIFFLFFILLKIMPDLEWSARE